MPMILFIRAVRPAGGAVRIDSRVGVETTARMLLRQTDEKHGICSDEAGRVARTNLPRRMLLPTMILTYRPGVTSDCVAR